MTATRALAEVAQVNPSTLVRLESGDICSFVPMDAVDETTASISRIEYRHHGEVAKGYTAFSENDVLLAKITPCMENGKCAIARRLKGGIGFGSTEFHVVRASKDILPEWIYYFWRRPETRKLAERNMTGSAGQRRVPTNFMEQLEIPLPTIDEQERSIAQLQHADQLRHTRRYALQLCDELLPAAFLEMFGDPLTNPHDYPTNPVSEVCELVRGSSPRPQGDPRFFGGPVPRLMISDISRDGIRVTPRIDSLTVEGAARSRPMRAGSVVMAVSANVGLPAILSIDACIHDGFVGFRDLAEELSPVYFYFHLLARKKSSFNQATGAIWQNITTDQISEWEIPTPSHRDQKKFLSVFERLQAQRATYVEALRQADHLFQTLLHDAFQMD